MYIYYGNFVGDGCKKFLGMVANTLWMMFPFN